MSQVDLRLILRTLMRNMTFSVEKNRQILFLREFRDDVKCVCKEYWWFEKTSVYYNA